MGDSPRLGFDATRSSATIWSRWALLPALMAASLVVVHAAGAPASTADLTENGMGTDAGTWGQLLDARTLRRILVAPSGDPDADVARAVRIIETVSTRHRDLIPPERIDALTAAVHFAEVDRTYSRVVLEPLSTVSEKEVRAYFDTHREGFRRPAGAKLLEIFLWAPEDLPERRAARFALLGEIRKTAVDQETFSTAAEQYSDATSYQNGGRIGTLMADQVDDHLREVIFDNGTGPTEIISTAEGHYLFFITHLAPPRERPFDEVAGRITTRLTRQVFEANRKRDDARLADRYSIDLEPKVGLIMVAGTTYTLATAGLSSDLQGSTLDHAVARRALEIARETELRALEIDVETSPKRLALALHSAIYPVLLKARLKVAPTGPAIGGDADKESRPPRKIQRWDFEMLTLADDGGQDTLFALLRTRHNLKNRATMEDVRAMLEARFGLTAEVVRRTGLLATDAAGLGPEIYRTLKHHLDIGDLSRPLHLRDAHRFIMVRLTGRTLDAEAGVRERTARDRSRARRLVRAALERELLGDAEPRGGGRPDDLLESQRRQ